ncbi:M20/M25/M40 family metallo-hydrolase [Streptomyces sp. NPDC088762]|uniref:M20/M25/M40 family metallo-hydrolase n=1 Tax=Streptomyces sp. NPDC088762 TaxID=3365891 RepID=UPI0038072496
MTDPLESSLRQAVVAQSDVMLGALAEWVSIASVSADPARKTDVTRSARWLCATLRTFGFPMVEEWSTDGLPAVYACWPADDPAADTLLVYSHHDVHAVKEEEWCETSPFTPALRDGRLFGRGASDAKGQVISHLWALRAHLSDGRTAPPVTLKLLIEGEEEIGSVHLADLLADHREALAADLVMVSDTMLWSLDDAAVCTTVRGSVNAHLEIRGAHRDVHSGAVSGAAPNPLTELCRILGQLHDDEGRITLPGFYDSVRESPPDEQAEQDPLPAVDHDAWLSDTGTFAVVGEEDRSIQERIWFRPSAEVSSMVGGDPEEPARGVIPAAASADLLLRLVPDQSADEVAEQLGRWLEGHGGKSFQYDLEVSSTKSDPYTTPADLPALAVLRRSMADAFGGPPRRMGNGGAAPAAQLSRAMEAPVLFFGTGLLDDRWHGPDEKVEAQALIRGAHTLAAFYRGLS